LSAQSTSTPTFWDMPAAPVDPTWGEKRRLASELRTLAALCVTTDATQDVLAQAADAAARISEQLAQYPQRTFRQGMSSCVSHEDFARFADRSTMTGLSNPNSPPMELSMKGDHAIAHVTFGPPFEGIPGHVHGGLVAAAFDQLFGYLQVKHGAGAVTGELTVRYRRPTPLLTPLVLEARVLRVEGRRSVVAAQMFSGETVTAEADGIFIHVGADRLRGIIAQSSGG
jgi:acyl-coenzyme A thioesterase PaaI-like protein